MNMIEKTSFLKKRLLYIKADIESTPNGSGLDYLGTLSRIWRLGKKYKLNPVSLCDNWLEWKKICCLLTVFVH